MLASAGGRRGRARFPGAAIRPRRRGCRAAFRRSPRRARATGSAITSTRSPRRVLAQAVGDQRGVRRVDPHAADLLPAAASRARPEPGRAAPPDRSPARGAECAGRSPARAAPGPPRPRARSRGAQAAELVDGPRQPVEHRLQLRAGAALAPGRLALAQSGGVRFAHPLLALLLAVCATRSARAGGSPRRSAPRGPPVGRERHALPARPPARRARADRPGWQHPRRHTARRPRPSG